jgi:hypothetical protein
MNSEVESPRPKITPTGSPTQVQDIVPGPNVHSGLRNSRVVAHQYEPLPVSPAEQAVDNGVIR